MGERRLRRRSGALTKELGISEVMLMNHTLVGLGAQGSDKIADAFQLAWEGQDA
jgi:hypothetical protein